MKAIILAGGRGTRLESVIYDLPKPLAPVKGKPFISIIIKFLAAHGIDKIIISTGHLAEKFDDALSELQKIIPNISLVQEFSPLGTGGAVKLSGRKLEKDESVLVLNGDTFFNFDLKDFIDSFRHENAIALRQISNSSRYGTVKLANEKVTDFVEKNSPESHGVIYAGFAILQIKDILSMMPEGNCSLEKDFFSLLVAEQKLSGKIYDGEFIDIGIPQDYELANTSFNFSKFLV